LPPSSRHACEIKEAKKTSDLHMSQLISTAGGEPSRMTPHFNRVTDRIFVLFSKECGIDPRRRVAISIHTPQIIRSGIPILGESVRS
jgi:hypothetical protein